ncbi:MAG: hypothetical protein GDA49_02590 [Rhodospirillales bacterium]|nr:hypothetical protein [Rhodospirillales bacterium]
MGGTFTDLVLHDTNGLLFVAKVRRPRRSGARHSRNRQCPG